MRLATTILIASAALVSAPLLAQASTAPAPAPSAAAGAAAPTASAAPAAAVAKGATVYDVSGGVVGTVESIETGFATVSTGKNKARLPLNSFAAGEKGPLLGMTRDELDAAASAAAASSAPASGSTAKGADAKSK